MSTTIAVTGKGGTGKTSISAILIRLLSNHGIVLAIDADPSMNLSMALGFPVNNSIGRIREDMTNLVKKGSYDNSIAKPDYLQLKVMESLVESDRIDLLSMGRPEGPGCYCAANNMLRVCIDKLAGNYDYVVIDCEAGMEHISRQTTRDIDILLIISDMSIKGLVTAVHMKDLMNELRTSVGRISLVLNRVTEALSPEAMEIIKKGDLDLISILPEDPNVTNLDAKGQPLYELRTDSPIVVAVAEIAKKLGLLN